MKKRLAIILVTGLSLLVLGGGCKGEDLKPTVTSLESQNSQLKSQVQDLQKKNAQLKELTGPPPAALDNLYPPKAPAPLWLLQMFAMSEGLEAFAVDLMVEQDMANVPGDLEKFKSEYAKTREMAPPEWKDKFPAGPLNDLDAALKSGDPAKVGPAFGAVGGVCGSCHLVNQLKVQQKYHWPPFSAVQVSDPVTKQNMSWSDFMMQTTLSLSGALADLGQGQPDKAKQNFDAFQFRFNAMADRCSACHSTPRAYFVDASVKDAIAKLGAEIAKLQPNPEVLGGLAQTIGNESCAKCHYVHVGAARAAQIWDLAK